MRDLVQRSFPLMGTEIPVSLALNSYMLVPKQILFLLIARWLVARVHPEVVCGYTYISLYSDNNNRYWLKVRYQ